MDGLTLNLSLGDGTGVGVYRYGFNYEEAADYYKWVSSGLVATTSGITSFDATVSGNVSIALGSVVTFVGDNLKVYLTYDPKTGAFGLQASGNAAIDFDFDGNHRSVGGLFELSYTSHGGTNANQNLIKVFFPFGYDGSGDFIEVTSLDGNASVSGKGAIYRAIKVVSFIASFFGFGGPIDGASVYVDSNSDLNLSKDPAVTTDSNGEFTLPSPATGGQLVLAGGTDLSTGLRNRLVMTAPYDSRVISSATSLVNSLMQTRGLSEAQATGAIDSSLGIGSTFLTLDNPLLTAGAGDKAAGAYYRATVGIDSVAELMSSLIQGQPGAPDSAHVYQLVYQAIANWFYDNGETVNLLTQPSAIDYVLAKAAVAAGVNLSSDDRANAATIISAILKNIESVTVDGTRQSLDQMTKGYVVASGDLATQFSLVGSGYADLATLVNQYTGSALSDKLAATVAGPLFVGAPQITVQQVVSQPVGAGDPTTMDFPVYLNTTGPITEPVTVHYSTVDGSATAANGDYDPVQGTLTWLPGDTSPKTISVPVHASNSGKADLQFGVRLTNGQNATISQSGIGIGDITYADYATSTSITSSTASSKAGDSVTFTATVSTTGWSQPPASGTVTFTQMDGTVLGTADLVNGVATLVTTALPSNDQIVTATYNGSTTDSATYQSSSDMLLITVASLPQTITFAPPADQTYPGTSFVLDATASSGLAVFYRVVSGPAILHDNVLVITGTGTVQVEATQIGDQTYSAADPVVQSFNVSKAPLTYTVANQTIAYGSSLPTFAGQFSGFADNEDESVVTNSPVFSLVGPITGAGLYEIDASGGAATNYQIGYVPGTLTVTQAITGVTLSVPATGAYGQSRDLTATVTHPAGTVAATGTVSFFDNGVKLGDVTLVDGVATFSGGNWYVGDNYITALYNGDSNYISSQSSDQDLVVQNQARVSVAGPGSSVVVNRSPVYTATVNSVADGRPLTDGTIQFQVDGMNQGSPVPIDSLGRASFTADPLTYGSHTITAVFSGNDTSPGTSGSVVQSVVSDTGSVTIQSSATTLLMGQSVTFTAAVTSAVDGQVLTDGTIQFQIDGVDQGSQIALDGSGLASFSAASLSAGTHTITAIYSGDSSIVGTTQTFSQSVIQDTSAATLSSSIAYPLAGDVPTITTTITSSITGLPLTTGTVQFAINGVNQGSPVTLDASGTASFTVDPLSAGTDTITVVYSGDVNTVGSTQTLTLSVGQFAATTSLVSPVTGSTYGQSVTYTAQVLPADSTQGTPDGTVQFFVDGVATGAPVAIDANGNASSQPLSLGGGDHNIQAVYTSSNGFQGGSDQAVLTVQQADQTISFGSLGTATFGDGPIVLSATSSSGLAVTYSVVSGPGFISDGQLFITGAGSIVVEADQAGDLNYNPATSVQQALTVNAGSTVTTIVSSGSSSTYGDLVSVTATVTANGVTPVGQVQFAIDGINYGTAVTLSVGSASVNLPLSLSAGSHTITATFVATTDLNASTSNGLTQNVAQAQAGITVSGYSVTYDGTPQTAIGSAYGVDGSVLSGLTLAGTTHTNAGTTTDTWTFHDPDGNYADASGTVTDVISQATASITVTGYTATYNSQTQVATASATGVGGIDLSSMLTLTGTRHTNAGVYLGDTWSFHDPSGNYADASGTVDDVITQATASITVTAYGVTYNALAHTASGSATGFGSVDLSSGLTLTGTSHTNAGVYAGDIWTFHDASGNYADASGTVDDAIGQATASINVTPYAVTFDAQAHTASGTATGIGSVDLSSGLTLTGTTHKNAGVYTGDVWTFHDANGNYADASGTVNDSIAKATARITITPYTSTGTTYTGTPHTATGTVLGIGNVDLSSGLNLSGTTHTNAGTYTGDTWSFAGGINYNNASGIITDSIGKAKATISVNGYNTPYDAKAHTASGTATGIGGIDLSSGLTLTATTHTNAGYYVGDAWTFHDLSGNYADASGTVNDAIGQSLVTATITVTAYNTTYDTNAHTASGTAKGIGGIDLSGDLTLTGTSHVSAGSYDDRWTFHDPSGNYADASGIVNDLIAQASATINVTAYSTTYDTSAHAASGTAKGIGGVDLSGNLTLTGTSHTNAGTYNGDAWSFHDPSGNYADANGTVNDIIGQANATINVTGYNTTYNANVHTASGTAKGIGGVDLSGNLTLTGTSHSNAGTYNGDAWSFHDPSGNYADASGTVNDAIAQANATINVTAYSTPYDTSVHTASGSATGVGGVNLNSDLTLSGTAHTSPGIYNGDPWSFHDPAGNYTDASGTVNDLIFAGPVITTQPVSTTVNSGSTATFTAAASGTPTPTVQWQVSLDNGVTWNSVAGATTATYSFTTTAAENNWQFRAVFKNVAGTATTNAVNLSVATAPAVSVAPTNTTVNEGAQASFTAKASGSPTPAVQWQVSVNNGSTWTNISGATSSTYSFTTAATDNGKQYRAVFTNSVGSATTTSAVLSVIPSTISANVIGVGIKWGTAGSAALFDATGGTLLPNGRTVDIPWANINQISITLNHSVSALNPADVSVSGSVGGNYGPVAVTGSGTSWTITLAKAIANADKVTVVIGNTQLTSYQRILNILPGDVNDDGLVTSADVTLANNAITLPYNIFADFYGDGVDDSNNLKGIRGKLGTKKIL